MFDNRDKLTEKDVS